MLQYFEKIWPLVESLWCALQDELYIMGYRAAGDLLRHQMAAIKIMDYEKNGDWHARHVEYDIIKHFASISQHFVLLAPKKREKHAFLLKYGLITCYL